MGLITMHNYVTKSYKQVKGKIKDFKGLRTRKNRNKGTTKKIVYQGRLSYISRYVSGYAAVSTET